MPYRSSVVRLAHKLSLITGFSRMQAQRRPGVRILMYHGLEGDNPAEPFRVQLEYLARYFEVVSLATAVERLLDPEKCSGREVALTFDDGLRNNYTVAYPVLKELGLTATFYVCPGLIESGKWQWSHEARERLRSLSEGERGVLAGGMGASSDTLEGIVSWMKTLPPETRSRKEDELRSATPGFRPSEQQRLSYDIMSWSELRELDPRIVTIGAHGVTHTLLGRAEDDVVRYEIEESGDWLERELGRPIEHFSYPDGASSEFALKCAKKRYRCAVTTEPRVACRDDDRHHLPRIPSASYIDLLAWRLHRPTS